MSIHEECGVFGVYSETREDVASLVYYGLYALQHRGQEGWRQSKSSVIQWCCGLLLPWAAPAVVLPMMKRNSGKL